MSLEHLVLLESKEVLQEIIATAIIIILSQEPTERAFNDQAETI